MAFEQAETKIAAVERSGGCSGWCEPFTSTRPS